jgi:hypothetical protein
MGALLALRDHIRGLRHEGFVPTHIYAGPRLFEEAWGELRVYLRDRERCDIPITPGVEHGCKRASFFYEGYPVELDPEMDLGIRSEKRPEFAGIDLSIDPSKTGLWRSNVDANSWALTLETFMANVERMKALPPPEPWPRIVTPQWWARAMEEHRGVYHEQECTERWHIEADFNGWTGCTCAVLYGAALGRS